MHISKQQISLLNENNWHKNSQSNITNYLTLLSFFFFLRLQYTLHNLSSKNEHKNHHFCVFTSVSCQNLVPVWPKLWCHISGITYTVHKRKLSNNKICRRNAMCRRDADALTRSVRPGLQKCVCVLWNGKKIIHKQTPLPAKSVLPDAESSDENSARSHWTSIQTCTICADGNANLFQRRIRPKCRGAYVCTAAAAATCEIGSKAKLPFTVNQCWEIDSFKAGHSPVYYHHRYSCRWCRIHRLIDPYFPQHQWYSSLREQTTNQDRFHWLVHALNCMWNSPIMLDVSSPRQLWSRIQVRHTFRKYTTETASWFRSFHCSWTFSSGWLLIWIWLFISARWIHLPTTLNAALCNACMLKGTELSQTAWQNTFRIASRLRFFSFCALSFFFALCIILLPFSYKNR